MVKLSSIKGTVFRADKVPVHDKLPNYEGDYSATPQVWPQTFETKDKSMVDDFEVEKIPYQEVSNPSGGLTATIGGY
mgnify:CR=1 FL=1